jgi:hypothetical protein
MQSILELLDELDLWDEILPDEKLLDIYNEVTPEYKKQHNNVIQLFLENNSVPTDVLKEAVSYIYMKAYLLERKLID